MQVRNSAQHYGAIAMTLHWLVAVLVLCSWLTGQFGDLLPRGPQREAGLYVHNTLGLAIVAFTVARLIWRMADPPPAPEISALGRWVEMTAQAVHYILSVLLFVVAAFGIAAQFAHGHALPIFGLFEVASPWAADRTFAHDMTEVHEAVVNGLLILIGLHAAAALVHHYVWHDRTLVRMLPGSQT